MSTRNVLTTLRSAALCVVALLVAHDAGAQGRPTEISKLHPVLQARARQLTGRSRVIVQFRDNPDLRVITGQRAIAGRSLPGLRGQVAEVDNTALAALAQSPQVASIRPDHPVFATLDRTGNAVGATIAREQYGVSGRGVTIAVIDSGITGYHDDLYVTRGRDPRADNRVVHFRDFTASNHSSNGWEQPSDDYGHGTHVAGIIAGNGFDSDGARSGVAPQASLVGLRVLDARGVGYISDVIAAIDYAIANRDAYNIRVINLSVASGVFESYNTDPLALAAKRAVDAGIVVVAAAGNLGLDAEGNAQRGGITSPGNAPWVLTVGAASHQGTKARSDDIIGSFSSRGPTWIDRDVKPDLVAPGVGIESLSDRHSTLYSVYADYLLEGTRNRGSKPYLSLTGTSMAAPVVAGTVALMLEANPKLTPNAVKAILQYTAQVRDDASWYEQGAGLLNTAGAVRMAAFFAHPYDGLGAPGDLIQGEWVTWGQHILWGNTRIAGGLPLPGSNAWNVDVQWGSKATADGQPVVWGVRANDTIVWSTHRGADDTIVWSTNRRDTIVWSTSYDDDTIVWSTSYDDDTIVWSTANRDTIVWSTYFDDDTIVWSTYFDTDTIVWSTYFDDDTIVWSTYFDDTIVWSTNGRDTIVWSTYYDDTIVWSTAGIRQTVWPAQPADTRRRTAQ